MPKKYKIEADALTHFTVIIEAESPADAVRVFLDGDPILTEVVGRRVIKQNTVRMSAVVDMHTFNNDTENDI